MLDVSGLVCVLDVSGLVCVLDVSGLVYVLDVSGLVCVLDVSVLPLSTIFHFDSGTVPTLWYLLFFI